MSENDKVKVEAEEPKPISIIYDVHGVNYRQAIWILLPILLLRRSYIRSLSPRSSFTILQRIFP